MLVMRGKIFSPQIFRSEISAADKGQTEQNEKNNENETIFGKATESALLWRRFGAGRAFVHRARCFSILVCALISLSYRARNASEIVLVPVSTGLQLVSYDQRGT